MKVTAAGPVQHAMCRLTSGASELRVRWKNSHGRMQVRGAGETVGSMPAKRSRELPPRARVRR